MFPGMKSMEMLFLLFLSEKFYSSSNIRFHGNAIKLRRTADASYCALYRERLLPVVQKTRIAVQ